MPKIDFDLITGIIDLKNLKVVDISSRLNVPYHVCYRWYKILERIDFNPKEIPKLKRIEKKLKKTVEESEIIDFDNGEGCFDIDKWAKCFIY